MKLSNRLQLVASFVTKNSKLADIGTDHGYIPIFLVGSGIIPYAYAMDINEGPLERAKEHIQENNLQEKIEVRLSNGLYKLKENEADSILIAGMGGALTCEILKNGWKVASTAKELILSPHSECSLVREYLSENGYKIVNEQMVMDMGKYYVVMKWVKGVEDKYLDYELRYGRLLLKNNDEVCFTYLNKEKENIEKIINSLPDNGKSDTTDRKKELILKLGLVYKALSFYDN